MAGTISINITCQDEQVKEKFTAISAKMNDDSTFINELKFCEDDRSIYELYKKYGYTDLPFDDFIVQFKDTVDAVNDSQSEEAFELSEEELENVVGGISFYKYFMAAISALPVTGPFMAGISKAYSLGRQGENLGQVFHQLGIGRTATVNIGLHH